MTAATLLAPAAGACAAAGLTELAAARAQRAGRERGGLAERAVRVLVALGRWVGAPAPLGDLEARIDAAGRPFGLGPAEVTALRGAGAVTATLLGAPLATSLPGRLPVLALLVLPPAGLFAPDWLLARRARSRGRRMERDLPDLLDLLRVGVEAGLPLARALGEVGRRHRGELAAEWRVAAAQIELGAAHEDALEALARRCPLDGMTALAASLRRAERHGAPLSETLAAQALQARAARATRVRERAARAAPKIQLVVALLLVPSVLLLVAAALVDALVG